MVRVEALPNDLTDEFPAVRLNASNQYDSREAWLRAATAELRLDFRDFGYKVPDNIRFAIAFPSTGRRSAAVGECWYPTSRTYGFGGSGEALHILRAGRKMRGPRSASVSVCFLL